MNLNLILNVFSNPSNIKLQVLSALVCQWSCKLFKQLTATVLLDMSRAFDSVDHEILMTKLEDVEAIKWFRSCLQSRYQVVKIHKVIRSDILPVARGVPQGSILGPLLFSIHANELPSIPVQSSAQCYVDGTKLLLNFNLQDQSKTIAKLTEDLCRISN